MLSHVAHDRTYRLQTDASDRGVSGILYQDDAEGNMRIVSLVSRCLKGAETRYNTTEKELLAIVYSLLKLRVYLLGRKFVIITDHKCLTFLNSAKFQSSRLQRWSLFMQQYDFTVQHCRGKDNIVADFFSRHPNGRFADDDQRKMLVANFVSCCVEWNIHKEIDALVMVEAMKYDDQLKGEFKNMQQLQEADGDTSRLRERVANNELTDHYQLYRGILFQRGCDRKRWCVVVPVIMRNRLIDAVHERLGHVGGYKTTEYLRRYFLWKNMSRDVKGRIRTCDLCQRAKASNILMEGNPQMVKSLRPNDLVAVDFYGPLPQSCGGVQYIFVMLDIFSKYVKLYPIKRATTQAAINKIASYITEVGKPQRILSDHGTQFTSPIWQSQLAKSEISVCFSPVRHPQSNPAERIMRELGRLFRTLCHRQHTRWAKHVPEIEKIFNLAVHSSTGFCPYELHYGKSASDEIQKFIEFPQSSDISRETVIMHARDRMDKEYSRRSKMRNRQSKIEIRIGDMVLLRVPHQSSAFDKVSKKFFHLYEGPYEVQSSVGANAYRLIDPLDREKIIGTYHRTSLKIYHKRDNP